MGNTDRYQAQYPQANLPETAAAALNFSQTGFGLKLQLQLTMGSDVSGALVEREILRAILLEECTGHREICPPALFMFSPRTGCWRVFSGRNRAVTPPGGRRLWSSRAWQYDCAV